MAHPSPGLTRQQNSALTVGGPTLVLDVGGLRIVTDPTFDPPGPHGPLMKTHGPAVEPEQLGTVDVVLLSHDNHADNFDDRGRALAMAASLVLTTPGAARRLGEPALGLDPWTRHTITRADGNDLHVTAVPAIHGPADGARDPEGNINCEVSGFVVSGVDVPTIYISGDNASMRVLATVSRRFPSIDVAVLHAGAARVPGKLGNRLLSLDSPRSAAAAGVLDATVTIPVHHDGWRHFTEGLSDIESAFDDSGLRSALVLAPHGTWIELPHAVTD